MLQSSPSIFKSIVFSHTLQMFAKTDATRTTQFLDDFKTAGEMPWNINGGALDTWSNHVGLPFATVRIHI